MSGRCAGDARRPPRALSASAVLKRPGGSLQRPGGSLPVVLQELAIEGFYG